MLDRVLALAGPLREVSCLGPVRCWVPSAAEGESSRSESVDGHGPLGPTFVGLFSGHDSAVLFVEDLGEELGSLPPLDDYYDGHVEGSVSVGDTNVLVSARFWSEDMEHEDGFAVLLFLDSPDGVIVVCIGQRIVHETLTLEPDWAQLARWEPITGPLTSRSWSDERTWTIGAG